MLIRDHIVVENFNITALKENIFYTMQGSDAAVSLREVRFYDVTHYIHTCVVIFFWSSGIMECTCMLFTFENGVPLMR